MAFEWITRSFRLHHGKRFTLGESRQERGRVVGRTEQRGDRVAADCSFQLASSLDQNEERIKTLFHMPKNRDIILRKFKVGDRRAMLVLLDGLTNKTVIQEAVLKPLLYKGAQNLQQAADAVVHTAEVQVMDTGDCLAESILEGKTALFLDGEKRVALLDTKKFDKRSISEPVNESVIKGPQQGFIEDLRTNISLVRNIVRSPDLVTEFFNMGGDNNLRFAMLYRDGVTSERLLKEIKKRIGSIQRKGGFKMGDEMLETMIQDRKGSLFPQALHTERPDRTAAFVTQGHVVMLCDGSPFALILPITFFALLHSSDDHFQRPLTANIARAVRLTCILLTIFLPGMFLAIMEFHQKLVPTQLMLSVLSLRQTLGIPLFLEIILMSAAFELVRESCIRVQGGVSQSIGIVGGLVLGQAAVSANIVSPIVIIVVSVTGICTYAIPDYSLQMACYTLRLVFILLGHMMGMAGVALGFVVLLAYMCTFNSFGVPFMTPFAPKTRANKDILVRGLGPDDYDIPDYINAGDKQR